MRSAMCFLVILVSLLSASCLTVAASNYDPVITKETTGRSIRVQSELKDIDTRISKKEYEEICSSWIGRSEKDVLLTWGSPSFARDIDESDSLYIYQIDESRTETSGGNLIGHTDLTGKTDYYTKSDEVSTVSSNTVGKYTFQLSDGIVKELQTGGSKPEKCIKKPSSMVFSDEYYDLQTQRKAILEERETVGVQIQKESDQYNKEHPVAYFFSKNPLGLVTITDLALIAAAIVLPLKIIVK